MPVSSLVDLVRQTAAGQRRTVLLAVAELFAERPEAYSKRELSLFGDVIGRLLEREAVTDRRAVSLLVAPFEETPHDLALKLAGDEAPVAMPLLEQSPVLTTTDLVGFASTLGQDHLLAISRRRLLPEPVSDVVVVRGNMGVHASVAGNLGAQLSEASFAKLAFKAKAMPSLLSALSGRLDLPLPIAKSLMPFVEPDARSGLERLIRMAEPPAGGQSSYSSERMEPARTRHEIRSMVSEIRFGRKPLDEAMRELIAARRLSDIAVFLAELALIKEAYVSTVMHKVSAVGVGLVCRSLEIDDDVYSALSLLRCERLRLPASQAASMIREYAEISATSAEKGLRPHRLHRAAEMAALDVI